MLVNLVRESNSPLLNESVPALIPFLIIYLFSTKKYVIGVKQFNGAIEQLM